MFRPMAFTVVMALAGSLLLALTFVPGAGFAGCRGAQSRIMKTGSSAPWPPCIGRRCAGHCGGRGRRCWWRWCRSRRRCGLFPRLGAVFLPSLEEGSLNITAIKLPSASITSSMEMDKQVVARVLQFPEVTRVFAQARHRRCRDGSDARQRHGRDRPVMAAFGVDDGARSGRVIKVMESDLKSASPAAPTNSCSRSRSGSTR